MINIKTFMDFTCPFSYIGFTILNKLRQERPDIEHVWYPYILNADTPLEGVSVDEKFDEEKKKQVFTRLEKLGKEYGLSYNNEEKFFNSNRAHKAALYARDKGMLYDFAKSTFDAVFERGQNIADKEVLTNIALELGLDAEEMNAKIDDGLYDSVLEEALKAKDKYNVDSVPTFIVDDKKKVTDLKNYNEFTDELLN